MAKTTTRELAYRVNDGVEVALLWNRRANTLTVSVVDSRAGESFELEVGSAEALDAFHHPYAHAAFQRLDYRASLREAVYA